MKKHYLVPSLRSFFANKETIDEYKCKYCSKQIKSYRNIKALNKSEAMCVKSSSKSTLAENISREYDCSTLNPTLSYRLNNLKSYILKKYNNLKFNLKRKYMMCRINLYVWWYLLQNE